MVLALVKIFLSNIEIDDFTAIFFQGLAVVLAVVIIFLSNIEIADFAAFSIRLAVIWIGSGIGSTKYIFSNIKVDDFIAIFFENWQWFWH